MDHTALRSNFDPSHFKNKKGLYGLFFQHFFSNFKKLEDGGLKVLSFSIEIEILEIPWVKITTESCVWGN